MHIPGMPPHPPTSTVRCDKPAMLRDTHLCLRQLTASKKFNLPLSIYLKTVEIAVFVVLFIESTKKLLILQSTLSIF